MVNVPKRNKAKVCIVCRNTVSNDRRTLTEAGILAKAGLEAVVIGLLGRGQSPSEIQDDFLIRRISSILGLAIAFRDHLYLPIYRKLPVRWHRIAKATYRIIAWWLRWVDRRLKKLIIYVRLLRAMLSEKADYYHAHHPFSMLVLTFIASILLRRRFIWDYNDILVLEGTNRVQNSYYEMNELWGKPLNAREAERVNKTVRSIPSEVSSILDVGCGDGRIVNRLVGSYPRVVGIDISKEALRYVQAEAIHGSVERLPFEDRSFDLVLTTELLEHLPEHAYQRALQEIQRVARRWILVGVPWKEQLSLAQARCIRCGTIFHVNHHFRSFDEHRLRTLLSRDFKLVRLEMTGGEKRTYAPLLLWIKRRIGGIWTRTPTTVCPRCKTHLYLGGLVERNAVSHFCDKRYKMAMERRKVEKSHVIALYARVEG